MSIVQAFRNAAFLHCYLRKKNLLIFWWKLLMYSMRDDGHLCAASKDNSTGILVLLAIGRLLDEEETVAAASFLGMQLDRGETEAR